MPPPIGNRVKGTGGFSLKKMKFLCNICCSPCSGASKKDSFVSITSGCLDAVTKLTHLCAFSQICMGKWSNQTPILICVALSWLCGDGIDLKIGTHVDHIRNVYDNMRPDF